MVRCEQEGRWYVDERLVVSKFDADRQLDARVARLPPVQHYSQATDFAHAGMVPAFSGKGSWRVSEVVLGMPLS